MCRASATHQVLLLPNSDPPELRRAGKVAAGMPTSRPSNAGASPLLSQTATGRRAGGTPWESQPEGGRRFTSHPARRPPGRYEANPSATGPLIQVGGSPRLRRSPTPTRHHHLPVTPRPRQPAPDQDLAARSGSEPALPASPQPDTTLRIRSTIRFGLATETTPSLSAPATG